MGIIFENKKYNSNFFEDEFFNKYLEKRDDYGDNGGMGGYQGDGQNVGNPGDQNQNQDNGSQGQPQTQAPSGGGGGGGYTPINLDSLKNNDKEEEGSILDAPMEIVKSKYFLIGCGAFVGIVILFFLLKYLIRHRKKPDLSKNFNRNYTKARDIIKHPDAESTSFDSRDEASGNLYRIESNDSMVKMFHSTDITYERNNGNMNNNSMVNLSQIPKNVSPLTPAHLINNQKSQSDLNNAHSLPNMQSSSSSISSQDSRTLINNRSRTFSSSNSNNTVKPQRRSRTNSSRARSSSTYYMSSDFVMTPFITKKIPGLEKNLPTEEEFVDYPPTPLPESLDDIPYSDNPDIDSEDTDNIVPPGEQIQKRTQSLPSSQNSPVSNKQMSPTHSQSQPMPQVPVRKQSQPTVQQSPPAQIPVRKQSQPMVQQSPPAPVRKQSQPMVQQSPPAPVRMQSQPMVQQPPPPPAPVRMQSQPMVQQSPPPPVRMQSQPMMQQSPPPPVRMQSQPMVQQSPPPTPARKQSQTVNHPQQMVNQLPPQPMPQQIPPIQTRTPQQTPNRIPSQPMPQQSPHRVQAYPNNQQSVSPSHLPSQNQMGPTHTSPSKQAFVPNTQSPKSPQPYRINQRGGPPKPQPRMSSRMEQSHPVEKQTTNRQSVVSVHFEIPDNNKELSFEEEMMASFDRFSSSFENIENVNTPNPRVAHTKQVI